MKIQWRKTKTVHLFFLHQEAPRSQAAPGNIQEKMQKCNILSIQEIKRFVDSKIFPVLQFLSAERREIIHSRSYLNFRKPIAKF